MPPTDKERFLIETKAWAFY